MQKVLLLVFVWVALILGCSEGDPVHLFQTQEVAPSLDQAAVGRLEHLGATQIDQGVNFGVYSEHATRLEILLFDDPESERPTQRFEMQRISNVWNLYVEGVGLGQHYGYAAWGPNWPFDPDWVPGTIHGFLADVDSDGNRFNPNKLLFDPYSVALHRDHDWSKGSIATGPARTQSTWAAASKSVVVASQYEWSENETAWQQARSGRDRQAGLNLYEVHPKGYTANPSSAVQHPGTFRGVGEKAAYLADLGINAVELMPVFEKPLDGTYWGYMTTGFFAPELSYAHRKAREEAIDEFKWMVDQLHQHGIQVILDVVYNHTGEGGLWRKKIATDDVMLDSTSELLNHEAKEVVGLYSYRGLDNQAYYALSEDRQTFWDNTGVGNDTRCNHTPMRRLILDSLHYWIKEVHVDGFRFDLAPILGQKDGDYNTWDDPQNTILQTIIDDPVVAENAVHIIAEPWSYPHFKLGAFPAATADPAQAWYEWNGHFRDVWRAFVNFDDRQLGSAEGPIDIGAALTGSRDLFQPSGRKPYHSVNFVTVHDGFTMYDLFSYDEKRNLCGPLNPVCCADPTDPFCDPMSGDDHNRSRDWGTDDEAVKRQLMRNLFVALLVSHGTPMLYAGDEWMRTQLGNNNAYSTSADNEYNWLDWGTWQADPARQRMHDFVRGMIQLRKDHAYAFAPSEYDAGAPFAWKNAQNQDMQAADWQGRSLMLHYYDNSVGPELLILINMGVSDEIQYTLPAERRWQVLLDTQLYFDTAAFLDAVPDAGALPRDKNLSHNIALQDGAVIEDGQYGVLSRTMVMLKALPVGQP